VSGLLALTSIKWQVAVLAIASWNLLFLLAMRLNGWRNRFEDPGSLAIVALACLALATFSGLVLWSTSFRNLVTSDGRRHLYEPAPFVLLLVLGSLLGVLSVLTALGYRL
jgi:hypothetical protein